MRKTIRIAAGIALLLGVMAWTTRLLTLGNGTGAGILGQLFHYFGEREARFTLSISNPVILKVGDAVEIGGKTVGEIEALLDDSGKDTPFIDAWTRQARIKIFDQKRNPLHADSRARVMQVPQAAAWVVKTLFTEETIPRIVLEWNNAMLEHREQIFALVTPIVRDLIIDVEQHVEAELPPFLKRHASEVDALNQSLREGYSGEKLTQIFEQEVWPIAQPKLNPIISRISDEIWSKLPLWGFTWRIAYQALPGTDNDHLQRAWLNFLSGEAMPILRSHTEEIIEAAKEIARDSLAHEDVHIALREVFGSIVGNPKFHELVQAFLREVMLDNPSFQEKLWVRARSPEVAKALEALSAHIEPMARRMGDIVLGTREAGITQEFAKVLRSQILLKDLERIVIDPGSVTGAPLRDGSTLAASVEVEYSR